MDAILNADDGVRRMLAGMRAAAATVAARVEPPPVSDTEWFDRQLTAALLDEQYDTEMKIQREAQSPERG